MLVTGKSKVKTMTVFKKQNTYRFKAQVINGNNRDDFLCENLNSIVGIANRTHRPTQTGMMPKIPLDNQITGITVKLVRKSGFL